MAKFGLVYNNKVVVGPREYYQFFFKEYLEKNNLNFSELPTVKEDSEPYITEEYKILPVTETIYPELKRFEQLSGPELTIYDEHITETYGTAPIALDSCKNTCKNLVADNRYTKETADLKLTIQDTEIVVLADRGNKLIISQVYATAPETGTINYKFAKSGNWLSLTKVEIGTIISALAKQTQDSFDWEKTTIDAIDAAQTYEELEAIDLGNPPKTSPFDKITANN